MSSFFLQNKNSGCDQSHTHAGSDKLRLKPAANQQSRAKGQCGYAQKLISPTHKKHPLHKNMQGIFRKLRIIHDLLASRQNL